MPEVGDTAPDFELPSHLEKGKKVRLSDFRGQQNVVLACSALKKGYRDELCSPGETKFVYLKGSYELISQRLRQRHGHFASETILASQFVALEEPDDAITLDIDHSEDEIVAEIMRQLGVPKRS